MSAIRRLCGGQAAAEEEHHLERECRGGGKWVRNWLFLGHSAAELKDTLPIKEPTTRRE